MKVTVMSQALVPLLKGLGNVEDFANPVAKLSMPGEVGDVVVVQAGEGAVARAAATGNSVNCSNMATVTVTVAALAGGAVGSVGTADEVGADMAVVEGGAMTPGV